MLNIAGHFITGEELNSYKQIEWDTFFFVFVEIPPPRSGVVQLS
jgi:hypothetical protein